MMSFVKKYVFRGIGFNHEGIQIVDVPCGETLSFYDVPETNQSR
jgi:hypothetical protein